MNPRISMCQLVAASCATIAVAVPAVGADLPLQEVVVTASLRTSTVADLPASVSVLDADTLQAAGVQHFEDVLGLVPNLSSASGTSRPRYFQLRGIGEVEQYQGAPNPSVGFLIDDIDFSGVGMPATLFDVDQIEVLRGPQGTAYGANALAGLISVHTRDPGTTFDLRGQVMAGDFGTRGAGVALGDGFGDGQDGWRVVAQQYRSDGFRHNAFLGRDDTALYDESTLRGKLRLQLAPNLRADLTLMHVDLDNGYDDWSIDNSFTTESNQPGRDAQRSNGAALALTATTPSFGEIRSVTSAADSHIVYSFDGDWGNDGLWASRGYAPYDYFEQNLRTRRTVAEDLRFIGDDGHRIFGRVRWLVGAYLMRLTESDSITDSADDVSLDPQSVSALLQSHYQATNSALYTSLDMPLGPRSSLTFGVRGERRVAHYADNVDASFPAATDTMAGGNLSWSWHSSDAQRVYATLARGFKAGGFNIGTQISPGQRRFDPEYLWNLEVGVKRSAQQGALRWHADVFYMRRQDQQIYSSEQLSPDNPLTYVFYTQNAAHGENYGLESQLQWQPGPSWQLSTSAALLQTRYLGYDLGGLDLDGRAQAFAAAYQLSAAATYSLPTGWFMRLDGSATDGFYFSASDNQWARAYTLVNLRTGYRHGAWTTSAWVRNLANQRYAINGFYFGVEPPDFPTRSYLQNGDPRQIGLTLRYDLQHNEEQ